MNITFETDAPCSKVMRVEVDTATVEGAFTKVTTLFQQRVRMPGFRPGKTPRSMVERTFGKEIEPEVMKSLIEDSFKKALDEHKLWLVGSPKVEKLQFERGKEFQYRASFETAPKFDLPEYKGLPAKRERRYASNEDVDRAINVLRDRQATFNDVDRPAATGDIVVVNYTGTSEGKPLTEFAPTARGLTQKENFWMEIKPGHFIPGFTEQLAGATKGEKRTVNVDFPEDFVAPQLAGKKGVYEVEVLQVKEKVLPEVNDAFAKSWNADNVDKLREGVRRDLDNELTLATRRHVRNQLVEELSRRLQLELPESLVKGATEQAVYDIVMENQQRGLSNEQIDASKDEIYGHASSAAKEKVKLSLILKRIATQESITVTQEDMGARVYQMAQQARVKPEDLVKDLRKRDQFPAIHEQVLLTKVVDFLEQNAALDDVAPQDIAPASPS